MKLLKTLVIMALLAGTAMAQNRVLSGMTWNIGLPTGRMANFLSEPSFGGFGIEARKYLSDEFSFGGSVSWNYWSEMTGEIIPLKQGALSGTQIRYINAFPLFLNAHYYIGSRGEQIRPYLGVNVGAYYMRQRLDMGMYVLNNDTWHFGLAPEAGFLVEVSRDTFISASGRYNYAFGSGETLSGEESNKYNYWGINIGIFWATGWL